jgi:hypothetical protein
MTRINIGAVGFGLVAFLFFVAAVLPSLRGGSFDATFFVLACVFFILAVGAGRNGTKPPKRRSDQS